MSTTPPTTTTELRRRARDIAGLRIAHLAQRLDRTVPDDLRRHKGWIGRLLEDILGADAANASCADFSQLGIELKTIPVDRQGRPRETTFVCSVPLRNPDETSWSTSSARAKLSTVLWVPILDDQPSIADRLVGTPHLWSPSDDDTRVLAEDWREHMDVIRRGYVDDITAGDGEALQIRPKGQSADSTTWSVGPDGESMLTNPRAFYLRTSFTAAILRRHFSIA